MTGKIVTHQAQVLDKENGREVACELLHEFEGLARSYSSELIIVVEHTMGDTFDESIDIERALSCLSDRSTRVLDLRSAISEAKAKDPSRYNRFYLPPGGHMSPEGNSYVAREISKILSEGVDPG